MNSPSLSRSNSDSLIYYTPEESVPKTSCFGMGKYKVEVIGAAIGFALAVATVALLCFVPGAPCVDVSSVYDALSMVGAGVGGAALGAGTATMFKKKPEKESLYPKTAFFEYGADSFEDQPVVPPLTDEEARAKSLFVSESNL